MMSVVLSPETTPSKPRLPDDDDEELDDEPMIELSNELPVEEMAMMWRGSRVLIPTIGTRGWGIKPSGEYPPTGGVRRRAGGPGNRSGGTAGDPPFGCFCTHD